MMRDLKQSEAALLATVGTLALVIIVSAFVARIPLSPATAAQVSAGGESVVTGLDATGFRSITVAGNWKVELSRGEDWIVELAYPESVAHLVRSHLVEDRLQLDFDPPVWRDDDHHPVAARIVMPDLEQLDIRGYNEVDMRGFEGARLALRISGNSTLDGHGGSYGDLDLAVAGAGRVNLGGIEVRNAVVQIAGIPMVTLSMNGGALSGQMAGAGRLDYYGQVSEETVRIVGIARIDRLD